MAAPVCRSHSLVDIGCVVGVVVFVDSSAFVVLLFVVVVSR
jgi:hypothetical protein